MLSLIINWFYGIIYDENDDSMHNTDTKNTEYDAVATISTDDDDTDDFNIYVQPINFPTVPVGSERLRITPTPLHTDRMIKTLVSALRSVFSNLNINLAA